MSLFTAINQSNMFKKAGREAEKRAEFDALNFRTFVIEDALAEPVAQSVQNVGSSNSETVKQLQREAGVKLGYTQQAILYEGALAKYQYDLQAAAAIAQGIGSTINTAFQAFSLAGAVTSAGAAADTLAGLNGAPLPEPSGFAIPSIPTPQIETDFNPDLQIGTRLGPGG